MAIIPIYLYGVNCVPEVGDGALFHYTKFEGFLNILDSMTLRSSPLCKMNDLNEADLSELDWTSDFLMMWNAQDYVRTKCSVISFSQNYEVDFVCREGSNHPALWAHYADDSKGVCIVLDRDSLLEVNKNRLEHVFYKLEDIEYTWNHSPSLKVSEEKYSSVSEFVQKNYRELFFKKDIDWTNEGEARLFLESPQEYLNIRGAIKHIVLGKKLVEDKSKMRKLLSIILSPSLRQYFTYHSFASMQSSLGGYITQDASSHIRACLEEMLKDGEVDIASLNHNWVL